jgi:hypothetical protein
VTLEILFLSLKGMRKLTLSMGITNAHTLLGLPQYTVLPKQWSSRTLARQASQRPHAPLRMTPYNDYWWCASINAHAAAVSTAALQNIEPLCLSFVRKITEIALQSPAHFHHK